MDECPLCAPDLGPILFTSAYWQMVLNRNQNLLGKGFLVLRRHVERVPDLTPDEWQDLHDQIGCATARLEAAFQPDHFNYVFLQNQERHVHLHVIPRYAAARTFEGVTFTDPGYPGHYLTGPGSEHLLSAALLDRLAAALRDS